MDKNVEKFIELHQKLVRKIFETVGEVQPMLVLLGKPIDDDNEKCVIKPINVPSELFRTEDGKELIRTELLKHEKEELKNEGYELLCISLTSECWVTKHRTKDGVKKVGEEKECIFFMFETKDETKVISWDIKRKLLVDEDGMYEDVELVDSSDFIDNGKVKGRFTNMFF